MSHKAARGPDRQRVAFAALWGRGMSTYFASDPTQIRLSVSAVVWRNGPGLDRELLLMQRSDNGQWGLPGGYVELGESVAQAAGREVREETGIEVRVVAVADGWASWGVNSNAKASTILFETLSCKSNTSASVPS